MANLPTQKSLRKLFEELPLRVRDWLTSERVTYHIIEMNKRVGLDGENIKVIPRLILRLIVKDLDPKLFITELSKELDLLASTAKTVTQEIETTILKPVEVSLRNEVGIDIKLLYLAEEGKPISPILEVLKESEPAPPKPPEVAGQREEASRPLIQTKEAAHPSFAKASEGKPQERQVPTPPPVPPRPSEPIIKAESAPEVKVPISVKKSKVAWGEGRQT